MTAFIVGYALVIMSMFLGAVIIVVSGIKYWKVSGTAKPRKDQPEKSNK